MVVVVGGLVTKSCPNLATPWTVATQAPLPMGFSRQEYWSRLPPPPPGDLPNPEIESLSPTWQVDSLLLAPPGASLVAQLEKNLPAMWETWVQSLGLEESLEKGTATHAGILAWRIPWAEESGGLQSLGSQRVGHD